jgi:hypothetical protein
MATSMATLQLTGFTTDAQQDLQIRTSLASTQPPLQSADLTLQQAINASATMLQSSPFAFNIPASQTFNTSSQMAFASPYDMPLHSSPTQEFIPTTQSQMQSNLESFIMNTTIPHMAPIESMTSPAPNFTNQELFQMVDDSWQTSVMPMNTAYVNAHMTQHTPESQGFLGPRSFSNHSESDNSWILIDSGRQSLDDYSDSSNVVSPQILHVRADSNSSDNIPSNQSVHSFDDHEIFPISPEPESQIHTSYNSSRNSPDHGLPSVPIQSIPVAPASSPAGPLSHSPSSSPPSGSSPKSKQRKTSPSSVTHKTISKKKTTSAGAAKGDKSEKRIGRRRGPLKPEQRQSAHEIRKLRACLRCKFLKKVCDKGDPCTGCQPSHARLWQVPCTRIDIKDIGYFAKEWNADYERHVTLGFSIANIKSFDNHEQLIYITHGYGFCLPIWARRVYVHDEECFDADWVEQRDDNQHTFEVSTSHLTAGADGIAKSAVSEYVDMHLDNGFDHFVKGYFDDTPFLSELLKSIHQYYLATGQENIRKGLRFVIAYALTLHITMVHGLSEDETAIGKIEEQASCYYGQTCAPVMINFQVKRAMADLWRDLMKEVLEELSALYSSVYNGEKFKNWPTIFMLAALILSVWEMMQFDSYYRVPDEGVADKFCNEMEHVPVGVIVGLFGAISTKLPTFLEWDTEKHGSVWNGNVAVCDTMTAVRSHVEKHGKI